MSDTRTAMRSGGRALPRLAAGAGRGALATRNSDRDSPNVGSNGQGPAEIKVHVVTGNLTREGTLVYLGQWGDWETALERARAFASRAEAEAELARVRADESHITEPYVFEALHQDGRLRPISAREILRAAGPSTRLRRPD